MSDNVRVLRLTSGEELIAAVESFDGNVYVIDNVAVLIPTQENSLGLAPFMAYCDQEKLELRAKDVMFTRTPVEGLAGQYGNMFGKIVTPSKKLILS